MSTARNERRLARKRGINAFHAEMNGTFEMAVFERRELAGCVACALDGDPEAERIASAIDAFLGEIRTAPAGDGPICLQCQCDLTLESVSHIMLCRPYAGRFVPLLGGVCDDCASKDDARAIAIRRLRDIWPDIYTTKAPKTAQ